MRIRGLSTHDLAALDAELAAGGRFVAFEYCISLVFLTFRRPSPVYFLRPGARAVVRGLPYTLVSLALGWWGVPWGLIYTPMAIFSNLGGGQDVTSQVRAYLERTADGRTE